MASTSDIEWTDATWNPVRGCTKISPGCKYCYAETFAERFRGVPGNAYEQGFDLREQAFYVNATFFKVQTKLQKNKLLGSFTGTVNHSIATNLREVREVVQEHSESKVGFVDTVVCHSIVVLHTLQLGQFDALDFSEEQTDLTV